MGVAARLVEPGDLRTALRVNAIEDVLSSETCVMLLIFIPLGSLGEDPLGHGVLSRDCYPRLMKAPQSVVRGLRIGVGT